MDSKIFLINSKSDSILIAFGILLIFISSSKFDSFPNLLFLIGIGIFLVGFLLYYKREKEENSISDIKEFNRLNRNVPKSHMPRSHQEIIKSDF